MITARFKCYDGERTYQINNLRSTGRIEHKRFDQDKLVKVKLFGELAKEAGRDIFELAVTSVREAISAIDHLSKHRTSKLFVRLHDKVRWKVIVNGVSMRGTDPYVADELNLEREIETIEIYPVAQGAGFNFIEAILGALLVIVGIVLAFIPGGQIFGALSVNIGLSLALGGVALLLGGLETLFVSPSQSQKQKSANNQPSYLFSGTVNVVNQGGPVPLAYGQLICGSQLIAATVTSSAVTNIGAANPPPPAPPVATPVTTLPPVNPGAKGWATTLPAANATQAVINVWWTLNQGYQVESDIGSTATIVVITGSSPSTTIWANFINNAHWRTLGGATQVPGRASQWTSALPSANASQTEINIWWNANLGNSVESIYQGKISYIVIAGAPPTVGVWKANLTTFNWSTQGTSLPPKATVTAKGPLPPANASAIAIVIWWNANRGLTVNSKVGLIEIQGEAPSPSVWAYYINTMKYSLTPAGSFDSSLTVPASDVLPVTITPMLQEYMDLAQISEWPNGPEILTAQPGAVQGQPFWAIKHWDGSLGLIYTLESTGPEQNFAFPQMIDESIVVTNAPSSDLTGYVNPNPIPPPDIPLPPILKASCIVFANSTGTTH